MKKLMPRLVFLAALSVLVVAGCQSDSQREQPLSRLSAKVLTFEVTPDFNATTARQALESVRGFLYLQQSTPRVVEVCFSQVASDEYLRKRSEKALGCFFVHFVSAVERDLSTVDSPRASAADLRKEVRKAIEKPEPPVHRFPNIFDLFRFLF